MEIATEPRAVLPASMVHDGHLTALDGMRGIAASMVMISHIAMISLDLLKPGSITFRLAHLPSAFAHFPVILFFALSGFVLHLAFTRRPDISYVDYIIRRIMRIYPALVVALAIAIVLRLVHPAGIDGAITTGSMRTDGLWLVEHDMVTIVRNILLFDLKPSDNALDTAIWSLAIEMRFSFLFPVLALIALRSRVAILCFSAFAAIAGGVLLSHLGMRNAYLGQTFVGSIALTLHYLPSFGFGIAAADYFVACRRDHRDVAIGPFVVVAFVAALVAWKTGDDFAWGALATALILLACRPGVLATLARSRFSLWLGRVSYSLYLIHFPVGLFVFVTLGGHVPLAALVLIAVALILVSAETMYRFVELPGITIGKQMTSRIRRVATLRPA